MVQRGHPRGVDGAVRADRVPALPDRGCAHGDRVEERRAPLLREEQVGLLEVPGAAERVGDQRCAGEPGGDRVAVLRDDVRQSVAGVRPLLGVEQVEDDRQGVRGRALVGEAAGRRDVLPQESGTYAVGERRELRRVLRRVEDLGSLCHLTGDLREVGGGHEVPVGLAAGRVVVGCVRVEPVAVLEPGRPRRVLVESAGDVADERRHRLVGTLEDRCVAVVLVERPGQADGDVAPQRSRRRCVRQDVRDDPRDEALLLLFEREVAQPGTKHAADVVQEGRRRGEGVDVAGPAEALVALRAVRGDTDEVVAHRPDDVLVQAVQPLVGGGQPPGAAHVGVDHDRAEGRAQVVSLPAGDLDVAETVEGEAGLPLLVGSAVPGVDVGGLRGTEGLEVDLAAGHPFGVAQDDLPAFGDRAVQADPAADLLAEVEDGPAGRRAEHRDRGEFLDPADRLAGGVFDGTGPVEEHRRGPGLVIEARRVPAVGLEPCVVRLAVVDRRAPCRAGADRPRLVGDDGLGAVGVGQFELHRECATVGEVLGPVVPAESAERPAVGDDPTDHVAARVQVVRDVVRRCDQSVPVRGPPRREYLVADPGAVQPRLDDADRRHAQEGTCRLRLELDLLAEVRRGRLLPGVVGGGGDEGSTPVERHHRPFVEGRGVSGRNGRAARGDHRSR